MLQGEERNKIPNARGLFQLMDFIPEKVVCFGRWQSELLRQSANIVLDGLCLRFHGHISL